MRLGRSAGTLAAVRGVQRKQLLSLGAVVALMVVLGLASGLELHQVQAATSRVGTKRVPAVQLLASVDADIRAYREVQLEHVLAKNAESQNPLEARMRASRAAVDSNLDRYTGFASRGEERQLLAALREAWARYVQQANDFLTPSRNQDVKTARGYLNGVAQESFVAISIGLRTLRAANDRAVTRDVQNSQSTTSFGLVLNLVLLGIAAIVAIGSQIAIFSQNMRTERFRSLVQRSSELTLVCDPAGHIGYASTAASEMLGVTYHQLLGRNVVDLIDDQHKGAVAELFAGNKVRAQAPVECQIAHADGSIRWVELISTDLTIDPAVKGVVVRLRDITTRRHLEIELRHAQKLESVGQLAAGIAHEINTPLQFIGDNVRFLTDAFADLATLVPGAQVSDSGDADGDGPAPATSKVDLAFLIDEIPQALAETLEGTQRVQVIVRAMKAFGHPGGEEKVPADINEAVENTVVVAGSEIKQVADVELVLAEDLPPTWCLLGDINQVLLNLIVNAAHAIGEANTGSARRGVITIRTRSDGEFLAIDIQDTGAGIPPEIADRIFDQFFTTKPVGKGTGQGLSLAHTLIHDRHGGTITFSTDPGAGTTFTVRIPHRVVAKSASESMAS